MLVAFRLFVRLYHHTGRAAPNCLEIADGEYSIRNPKCPARDLWWKALQALNTFKLCQLPIEAPQRHVSVFAGNFENQEVGEAHGLVLTKLL